MHAAMPREFTRSCTPKTFLFPSRVTRARLSGTPRTGNIARGTQSRRVEETSVLSAAYSGACVQRFSRYIVLSVAVWFFFVDRVHRVFRSCSVPRNGERGTGRYPTDLASTSSCSSTSTIKQLRQIIFNSSSEYILSPAEFFIAFRVATRRMSDLFESTEDAT